MDNKKVGYLLLGVVAVIIIIIFLFNNALHDIVNASCSSVGHGNSCPMYNTITTQTTLSIVIASLVGLIALFLILTPPQKEYIYKTRIIKKKIPKKEINTSGLKPEEKMVLTILVENKTIFQADLIEKTKFGKAKITRILDRLEGQGLIERKRRGMTNVVVLKEN